MTSQTQEFPLLDLCEPAQLPRRHAQLSEAGRESVRRALAVALHIPTRASDAEALNYVREAQRHVSAEFPAAPEPRDEAEKHFAEHDSYCCVRRVTGEPVQVFVHALLQSYGELLEEALVGGTSISPEEWAKLRRAFDSMLHYVALETFGARPKPAAETPPAYPLPAWGPNPLRRWILGHHVFVVIIQSLLVALGCFEDALKDGETGAAEAALAEATELMWGAAASLKFTGDFTPDEYDDIVRPTMMPPSAPPGMSGLLAVDHRCLVKTLVHLKEVFTNLDPQLRPQHRAFTQAFEATYESHKHVCAHFRGNERTSLLSTSKGEPATEVLSQLQYARLKHVKVLPEAMSAAAGR